MSMPRLQVALRIALLCVMPLVAGQEVAPSPDEVLQGGSFEIQGRRIEVSRAELESHFAFIRALDPKATFPRAYELAWSRAIRIHAAREVGIEIDEAAFARWMERQHRAPSQYWLDEDGKVIPAAIKAWLGRFGCATYEDYEALCRDEFLGEQFATRDLKVGEATEEETRKRYDAIHQSLTFEALTFAPETLATREILDPENPEHRRLYESWWATLSEAQTRVYDDPDRPAVESEVIYCQFNTHDRASFKKWFESPQPATLKSIAALTAHFEYTPDVRTKLFQRWSTKRDSTYAWLNREVPPGTNDEDSFFAVEDHLIREWRVIRYFGELWNKLQSGEEPLDSMSDVARRWGLDYSYIPLTPTRLMYGRAALLPGDHALYLKSEKPGSLFRYRTDLGGPTYFVDGPVEQPGIHVSIWRTIKIDPIRPPTAEEALEQAWPAFQDANDWRLVVAAHEQFKVELERLVTNFITSRISDITPEPTAEERAALERELRPQALTALLNVAAQRTRDARFEGRFHVRPFQPTGEAPRFDGPLGRRLVNLFRTSWQLLDGDAGRVYAPHDVLPGFRDAQRHFIVYPRILEVRVPGDDRYAADAAGRTLAQRSIQAQQEQAQRQEARDAWSWPYIVLHYKMVAPHFEEILSKARLGEPK